MYMCPQICACKCKIRLHIFKNIYIYISVFVYIYIYHNVWIRGMEQRYGTDPSNRYGTGVWNGGMERVWSRTLFRILYFDLHLYMGDALAVNKYTPKTSQNHILLHNSSMPRQTHANQRFGKNDAPTAMVRGP